MDEGTLYPHQELPLAQQIRRRKARLWTDRSPFDSHWQELRDFWKPRAGRFDAQTTQQGGKKHGRTIDSTGLEALRILRAGMMQGASPSTGVWFNFEVGDPELNKWQPVKEWLETCRDVSMDLLRRGNTFRMLPRMYGELGAFGTGAAFGVERLDRRTLHHYPQTIGQYALGVNEWDEIDTFYREFEMTVAQMVGRFGLSKVSEPVRRLYDQGQYDVRRTVVHAVEPRPEYDRDPERMDGGNMPFRSVYVEQTGRNSGSNHNRDHVLLEEGFRRFPVLAPRWVIEGTNVYGDAPCMEALGDVKRLQMMAKRYGQNVDYMTLPATQGGEGTKANEVRRLPGEHQPNPGSTAITPEWVPTTPLQYLEATQIRTQEQIRRALYVDMFLMIANDQRQKTAHEVAVLHEEKLTMLGPTLENVHTELLKPLVTNAFELAADMGLVPPPPPEIADMDYTVEFVSMLAQAQAAVSAKADDRVILHAQALAALGPDAAQAVEDTLDVEQRIRNYSGSIGAKPSGLRSPEEVQERREARAQAQQAAASMEMAQTGAAAAKDAAQAEQMAPGSSDYALQEA